MAQEVTSLVLGVDTSQVKTATAELDKMGSGLKRTETASGRLEKAFESMLSEVSGIGSGVRDLVALGNAANSAAAAAAKIAPQIKVTEQAANSAAGAMSSLAKSTAATVASMNSVKAGFDPFGGLGVTGSGSKATAAVTGIRQVTTQLETFRQSARLSANQAQQLSFQLNDFFVQVASGQSPLTALIQQGSQLSGTFGGIGGALKAVGSIFTTTRVLAGSLLGAVVGLGVGIYKGTEQSLEFARSLQLTGNAAGLTEGKFNALSKSIADSTKSGIGTTREVLQSLVSTGRFSGDALTKTAEAAVLFQKATGQSSEEVLKSFTAMRGGVARWAEETNKQYHFLTATQLEYIRTLEDQGRSEQAVAVTMNALAERVRGAAQNLGLLERTWRAVATAASAGWDAILGIGRESTPEDGIAALERRIAAATQQRDDNARFGVVLGGAAGNSQIEDAKIAGMEESLRLLRREKAARESIAVTQAKSASLEQAKIEVQKLIAQYADKRTQQEKELAEANAKFDKIGRAANDPERLKVLGEIRKKYFIDPVKSSLDSDLGGIKNSLDKMVGLYKGAESILEATRQAGLIDEEAYYTAKRSFLQLNAGAEVAALEAENKRLDNEEINAKDGIEYQNKRNANLKEIAANEAKIFEIQQQAAARGEVLNIQQAASVANIARSYLEARIAAEDFLRTLQRDGDRSVAAVGQSDKERNRDSGRAQIEDRYNQQRQEEENTKRRLESEDKFTEDARKQYDQRLAIIDEFQVKAVASWEKTYTQIGLAEADWLNGSSRAIKNYIDSAQNVSSQIEGAFTSGFGKMEDALVEFAMTGKLNFRSLANSIIADLIKIQARAALVGIFKAIAGGVSGAGSTGGGDLNGVDGFRAAGGPVSSGGVYQVNERGPEMLSVGSKQYLMMGDKGGNVKPSGSWDNGASVTYNVAAGVTRNELISTLQIAEKSMNAKWERRLKNAGV